MNHNDAIQQLGEKTDLWSPMTFQMTNPLAALNNKLVMLYFSAHWCRPCQRFTLTLRSFYQRLKSVKGVEDFEIVFCSMDRSTAEYQAYIQTMPWLCLPLGHPRIAALAKQYGVRGIPHLVILDKNGSVLISDGVTKVDRDPQGIEFPWRPKPMKDLFPICYQQNDNTMAPMSKLADKYLLLYFAARWCPASRDFTPKLTRAYSALQKNRKDFEMLFVSLDDDKESFSAHFQEMNFCALPYQEQKPKNDLLARLGVDSLPALVMLSLAPSNGGDRVVINSNVRPVIENGHYISDFPFHPKQYGDLNKTSVDIIQHRCVIVFHEGGDDCEQDDTQEAIQLAGQELEKLDPSLKLYWALELKEFSQQVRDALQLPLQREPLMVLLDLQNEGAYYISKHVDITMENIIDFVKQPGERRILQ